MSWTVKELASYRVYLNPRSALPGAALVDLRPATGGAFWLWFTPTSPLPPNVIGATTGTAYFPLTMLDTMIELVRSESPVFVQLESNLGLFSITTSQEPLGEGPGDDSL